MNRNSRTGDEEDEEEDSKRRRSLIDRRFSVVLPESKRLVADDEGELEAIDIDSLDDDVHRDPTTMAATDAAIS